MSEVCTTRLPGNARGRPISGIRRVSTVLSSAGVKAWLFGGWGLDARIGRITRRHGDVEFWVERCNSGRSQAALVAAGSYKMSTQPLEEACEFIWDGLNCRTAYFDRRADGIFAQVQGRWSDWLFPSDSFDEVPVVIEGVPVLAMSVAGMLAMKEQFPMLRHGSPWRPQDIKDISTL
jgi:Aminoglycoside-2''-adenylyltransferase